MTSPDRTSSAGDPDSSRPNRSVAVCSGGGKDSLLVIDRLLRSDEDGPITLLATIRADDRSVAMHRVDHALLRAQAAALDLPLIEVEIPAGADNDTYRFEMLRAMQPLADCGVNRIAFGDLFLTEIREFREGWLAGTGWELLFPLWDEPTDRLAREFLSRGFRATVCCVNTEVLPADFCGRPYDSEFLADLPPKVDPCGENGEFHTFVFDGPIFHRPVPHRIAETFSEPPFQFARLTGSPTDGPDSHSLTSPVSQDSL